MPSASPTRPTFLTVLCVLSFIAGLWGLWSGFESAFTDKPQREIEEAKVEMEKQMAELGDQAANPMVQSVMESGITMLEKAAENAKPMGYGEIVVALLSLFGVWQMWNLKKMGFWIYVLAAVIGLVLPLVLMGGGLLAILGIGAVGLVSLLFIILYGLNLKHMS